VCDAGGREVLTADDYITFMVEGPEKITGVGNGNLISNEPFADQERNAFNGLCLGVLQSGKNAGLITITVNSTMLQPARITLNVI
jgi:beta-galactosidase